MQNDNYFIADIYAHKNEHSMFAEAMLEYFNIYENSEFLLNSEHRKFVKQSKQFFFEDSLFKSQKGRLFNREFMKLFRLLLLLPYIKIKKKRLVILGVSNIQSIVLAYVIDFIGVKASVVMHSQLEVFNDGAKKRKFAGLFKKAFNLFVSSSNFNILVLGEHIKKNLESIGFNHGIFSIPHPLPISRLRELDGITNPDVYGIVGLIRNDTKNCNLIYDLKFNEGKMLKVVGRKTNDFTITKTKNIDFKIWDEIYSDADFNKEISNVGTFLYFFDSNDYKFTASGSALDAVIHGKAVISLNNPAVVSLLSGYPFITVCETLKGMNEAINSSMIKTPKANDIVDFYHKLTIVKNLEMKKQVENWLMDG